jgi:glycosyltransferase involved in cell wall biosynthesis
MNILHVCGKKDWGGGENQLLLTIKEIEKNNQINQYLLCPTKSLIFKNLQEEKLRTKIFTTPKNINIDPRYIYSIYKIVKNQQIDIIRVHDPDAHSLVIFAIDIFKLKIKVVLHKKTIFPVKNKKYSIYKYNHRAIKHIICVSEASKKSIENTIKNIPISVIHDAIEIKEIDFYESKNDNIFTILNVANHTRHKNLNTLIEIAHQCVNVEKLPFKFIQIGHGKLTEELIQKRDQLNLQESFEFLGFINDVDHFYKTSDAFLLTSVREGLGVSVLEASLYKLPIVSSNVGGIPEIIENNKNGLLCDYDDVNGYVENLKRIFNSKELTDKLTRNAHQKVLEDFSPNVMIEKLIKIYFSI